jgi:hypothetical protein
MRTDNMGRRNGGRIGIMAVAMAVLLPLIVLGTVSPAASQSDSTVTGRSAQPPAVIPDSPESTPQVFLPLLFSANAPSAPTAFGIQLYSDPYTRPDSAALPWAQQAHVSWVRWPIAWSRIEPSNTTPDKYAFDWLDKALLAFREHGIHVVITITGNPSWAATYSQGPIDKTNISEFAQVMGALVERYDGDGLQDAPGSPIVQYWEFYNEPDGGSITGAERGTGYWGDFGVEYAQMLCAVYPAMKAASPQAKIVLGGIAYDWFREDGGPFVREFLDDVLTGLKEERSEGKECLDVMNFHYYPPFEANWSQYGPGVLGKVNYLRGKLQSYGFGDLPMISTEGGYHSNNNPNFPSTPEIQASYVVKIFTQALAARLGIMVWFTWSDYETGAYQFANGLLDQSNQPKVAYYAYQTAAGKLGNAVFNRPLTASEQGAANVQGYLFDRAGPLYVLWSDATSSQSVSLPGSSARVIDYLGNLTKQIADGDDGQVNGLLTVEVGSRPFYVEVEP